jgi:predicted phage terminase large subunit-like protein
MVAGLRLPSRAAVQAQLARRSLAEFFRYSWPILEPATPLIWNWHLEAICDHTQALLEGRIPSRNLAITVPPGSSKSRIVSVCTTAWWWIDHPEWRGIYSSANPRNVIRDSLYCRQLIDSAWYQEWFKPTWRFARDQNAKGLYSNTAGGFRQAIGAGGAITGDRANGLFMDDMLDATKGESQAAREEFKTFYDQAFANRVSSMTEGTRCIIGQRLHEGDPVGHLLKSDEWELLVIRQEYERERENPGDPQSPLVHRKPTSIGWTDPRRDDNALMDPTRFPAVELKKERARLATRGYAAQHQQRPAPAEGAILKRAWFRWYQTPKGSNGEFLPTHERAAALGITRIIQGVDTALSDKSTSDYSADVTVGEAPARFYVLDYWKDKVDAPTVKSSVTSIHAKWGAHAVVVEGGSSASGKATVQSIKSDSKLPVIEMPVMGDKVVAMNAIAPTVEAGLIYLPDDQPWASELIESLLSFPVGEHDDDADAFRIAVWYLKFGGAGFGILEHMRRRAEENAQKKSA